MCCFFFSIVERSEVPAWNVGTGGRLLGEYEDTA